MDVLMGLVQRALSNFFTLDKLTLWIRALLLVWGGTMVEKGYIQLTHLDQLAAVLATILFPIAWSYLQKEWSRLKVTAAATSPMVAADRVNHDQIAAAAAELVRGQKAA